MKKVWLFSNWHDGVMVKVVVHQALGGEDRFPAGPRALLSWFQSGRKGLGSCNHFEELNKYLLTAYFEVIQEHFFREVTFTIFDQRDGEKDYVTDGKKDQVCCLKDGIDGVVSTASTTTSNPLSTLYCYDISGSNDRGG